ncbi:MAG: DUF938 domain-containing protein [Rhodobacteraceae bacterium]|nr:DUF938 domain-containing protein [Paracoccaceae bacterium]
MAKKRQLPSTASIADRQMDGRLVAPSAARNVDPILEVLQRVAPTEGTVLEIASGTGQHAVRFAAALPHLTWQPSDVEKERLASIRVWAAEAGLENLLSPVHLDATRQGWAGDHTAHAMVYLSNLLHLISAPEAMTLITEAALCLAPGGQFFLYGPFRRGDRFAGEGDERFHASLVAADPDIGYKSVEEVEDWMTAAGLDPKNRIDMPANNLVILAAKPGQA